MRYSIVTISYNSGQTIERTIKSVLAQGVKDYEYIIVDGGSKDNTLDIVRKYEPLFEGRLKWKSEPDKGIYNAMNKGISRSSGEVIGIVNSDDWLEPDALEKLNRFIEENQIDLQSDVVLSGWMNFQYEDGTSQPIKKYQDRLSVEIYKGDMYVNHPATFVSAITYKNHGTFDEHLKIFADNEMLIRFYQDGVPFHIIEEVLTNMGDGGASNHFDKRRFSEKKYILDRHESNIVKRYLIYYQFIMKEIIKWAIPKKALKTVRDKKSS